MDELLLLTWFSLVKGKFQSNAIIMLLSLWHGMGNLDG